MKAKTFLTMCLCLNNFVIELIAQNKNLTCGIDNSRTKAVFEGIARMETYPWLGILYYPLGKKRVTTGVVLITKQIVLGTASEIDKLPKTDFRAQSKVILGQNCSGDPIPVRDYIYHRDYNIETLSALALIQLDIDHVKQELRPICPPPPYFLNPHFYAMALSSDCSKPMITVYKMIYVDPSECHTFYRRFGLDIKSLWPTFTACAKASSGGECLWRSGAILVVQHAKRWRLLGFGVYGPGCEAPARFLDYGKYHPWVRRSVMSMGRPSITKLKENHIILRRMSSNLQRFGPCDMEETKKELFTDRTTITAEPVKYRRVRYNVTIYANVEYSCVVFRAYHALELSKDVPILRLRRWCAGSRRICYDFQHISIDFYVEIYFAREIIYEVKAYGEEAKIIDPSLAMRYANNPKEYVYIPNKNETLTALSTMKSNEKDPFYFQINKSKGKRSKNS